MGYNLTFSDLELLGFIQQDSTRWELKLKYHIIEFFTYDDGVRIDRIYEIGYVDSLERMRSLINFLENKKGA